MVARQNSVFSTCPQSKNEIPQDYLNRVRTVAQWSERFGCRGILVYADNGIVDPWLVTQEILQHTTELCPLVSVQPVYMHPYTVAKMVASLGHLYNRQIYLNMIAGGFRNDLIALNDNTLHDDRYLRLTEYTEIIRQLLSSDRSVTFEGRYYNVHNLKMTPPLSAELFPGIMMSGSSPAGAVAAAEVGAIAVKYPERVGDEPMIEPELAGPSGVRIGIITRNTTAEAWQVAHERFPADRRGQMLHRLAMQVSDSCWHQQLSKMANESAAKDNPNWLGPFENYRTFCPYLVGSYERVAQELRRYIDIGHDTFILDIPSSENELMHINIAFRQATQLLAATVSASC
ncbi:MAG: LLM class flavin-dependent oxidoreductase [Fuerstiella sp.]|nr:LLM class flavin-dependent oxidoreductase [Fuerstiella sp.]